MCFYYDFYGFIVFTAYFLYEEVMSVGLHEGIATIVSSDYSTCLPKGFGIPELKNRVTDYMTS